MARVQKCGQLEDSEAPYIVSKFEKATFIFYWELQNFSKVQNSIKSPPFKDVVGCNHERKWCIEIFPKNKLNGLEYIGVILRLSAANSLVAADYHISLVDSNRKILKTMGTLSNEFEHSGSGYGLYHWIKRSDLTSKEFVTNDTLRIRCCVTTNAVLKHYPFDHKLKEDGSHEVLARKQMKSFLTSGEYSDVTLKTTSSSLSCSKIILAAHSPVFHAMFNSGMLETLENVVKIEDFANEVVKGMVEFLYCRHVESLQENVVDLLKIADKYQIDGLNNMCAEFLIKELNVENAAETLILADLHGPLSFKQSVISFISGNRKAFRNTDGFKLIKERHKILLADLYLAQN